MKTFILALFFFTAGLYVGYLKSPILAQWKPATPAPVIEKPWPTPGPKVWTPTKTALDQPARKSNRN